MTSKEIMGLYLAPMTSKEIMGLRLSRISYIEGIMSSKTQRRIYDNLDVSGALALGFYEKNFKTLATDAENSLKRAWHKLERGLRIGRIREFVARETERLKMDSEDSDALFKLLLKALDRKLLNSKAAVTYDMESEQITEIKGLVSHTSALNKTKYQILEKKPAATQKKRIGLKDLPPVNSSEVKNETQPSQ